MVAIGILHIATLGALSYIQKMRVLLQEYFSNARFYE